MWDVLVLLLQLASFALLVYGGIIAIGFWQLIPESSPSLFDESNVIELRRQAQSSSTVPTHATSLRAQADPSGKSQLKRAA